MRTGGPHPARPHPGDSHVRGPAGPAGWWDDIVGPGAAVDTDRWFIVAPDVCRADARARPAHPRRSLKWASRFPYLTIRDQVAAQVRLADALGVDRWAAVIGGSMGGMHALEWGVGHPERVERLAVLSAPPVTTADQIHPQRRALEPSRSTPARRRVLRRPRRRAPAGAGTRPAVAELLVAQPPSSTSASSGHGGHPTRARSGTAAGSRWRATSLPRQQVHAPLRREQLHRARRRHGLRSAATAAASRTRSRALRRRRSSSASTATGCSPTATASPAARSTTAPSSPATRPRRVPRGTRRRRAAWPLLQA